MVTVDEAVVARLKVEGEVFEALVDCDLAIELKRGKSVSIAETLATDQIFKDAKKGMRASESEMEKVFGTSDPEQVAAQIIRRGEVQLTAQHRKAEMEEKRKRIIDIIHRNAVDPSNNLPHPPQRIENAFEEANVRLDEHKKAEDQVEDIIKKIRPILPIKFATKEIAVKLAADQAARSYKVIHDFGRVKREEWLNDGSYVAVIEMPAGLENDFYDRINQATQGQAETKVLKTS